MKITRLLITSVFAVYAFSAVVSGEEAPGRAIDLAEPVRLNALGKPIDVPGFAAPYYADFDGDGIDDLLVGQLDHGRLRIYRNVGTSKQPTFADFQYLRATGRVASVPTGCAVGFTPQMVDIDGDGDQDIVTGSFVGGVLFCFPRQADGTFSEAEVIANKQRSVKVAPRSYNSTVFAHDWDGDGDLDLLTGRSSGSLVINEGDRSHPAYGPPTKIMIDGKPLPQGRVPPVMGDWDGDGRDDLITGKNNSIVWYRNVSPSGSPKFEPARMLVSGDELGPTHDDGPDALRLRPSEQPYAVCVADFDDDGRLDLLLGDHYYAKRALSDEEVSGYRIASRARSKFWREYREMIENSSRQSSRPSRAEQIESFRVALRQWDEINSTYFAGPQAASQTLERHGGVWLYRRLATD